MANRPGLKKAGVVVLQSLLIFIVTVLELWTRGGAGAITGAGLCVVLLAGLRFGRAGTAYVSTVTPPLAFAATVLFYMLLSDGLHLSRVGIDFIAALASVAPFLIASALYGWFIFFNEKAKAKKAKVNG